MAKKKATRAAVADDRLDPPITAKERTLLRRFRSAMSLAVNLSFEAKDPGVGSMAAEIEYQNNLLTNTYIQAYRDGKAG